jgi:hypothetical protein
VDDNDMLYLDDRLPSHPKILKAGKKLGENGPALAVAMFITGLSYAREHLTDGFLPDKFVTSCGLFQSPVSVAKALSSRGVHLWHRTRGGYRIHDYHDWNAKASEIKRKKAADRERKRRERQEKKGLFHRVDATVSTLDSTRTSRARGTTYHVPLSTKRKFSARAACGKLKSKDQNPDQNPNPKPALKALVLAEVAASQRAGQLKILDVVTAVQNAITRSHLTADPEWLATTIAHAIQYADQPVSKFGNVLEHRRRRRTA